MIDRLVLRAEIIAIKGDSYRQHYNTYRHHCSLGHRTLDDFMLDWKSNPVRAKTLSGDWRKIATASADRIKS